MGLDYPETGFGSPSFFKKKRTLNHKQHAVPHLIPISRQLPAAFPAEVFKLTEGQIAPNRISGKEPQETEGHLIQAIVPQVRMIGNQKSELDRLAK